VIPIVVTPALWASTLEVFAPFASRRVEGGCFWYADADPSGDHRPVAAIGVPKQDNFPRNFRISADSLADLNEAAPEGAAVVAQLHSHPEQWVGQSNWDDELIVSRRILSVVLPHYAGGEPLIKDCGLHVFEGGEWRRVPLSRLGSRLIVDAAKDPQPSVIDLR
jgi:hypothetical protein